MTLISSAFVLLAGSCRRDWKSVISASPVSYVSVIKGLIFYPKSAEFCTPSFLFDREHLIQYSGRNPDQNHFSTILLRSFYIEIDFFIKMPISIHDVSQFPSFWS